MENKNTHKGIALAIIGSSLWGISGSVAQFVFENKSITPLWLVGNRLFFAGVLLLIWFSIEKGKQVFEIWKNWKNIVMLLLFSFLGMMPSQLTYLMAINYGNAPTATVLQFLGPLFIIIYLAFSHWQWPRRIDTISIILALFGTFLLVTQGNIGKLTLGPLALFWGLLAGLSQATYTLIPRKLLQQFDARLVVGWAMILGSLPFGKAVVTTKLSNVSLIDLLCVIFIIIFGTMFAYLLYLKSVQHIPASTTGMLSAFEPLMATIVSVGVLHTSLATAELIGGLFILATVFLQAIPQKVKSHH